MIRLAGFLVALCIALPLCFAVAWPSGGGRSTNGTLVVRAASAPATRAASPDGAASPLFFAEDGTGVLWTLDPLTGAATNIGQSGVGSSTCGLAPRDDQTLFGSQPFNILITQQNGSGATTLGPEVAEGLAYDRATDTLYGALNGAFFTIDTTTGTLAQPLPPAPGNVDIEGLDFGHGGVFALVGFAEPDSNLYFYEPLTQQWSVIGDTGIDWDLVGLAYDPVSDMLYAKGSQDTFLYSVDPHDATTKVIGDTGLGEGGGLAFTDTGPPTVPYCTGKTNTLGCVPVISGAGVPSATASTGFVVTARNIHNQKPGILLYTLDGREIVPFQGGVLCLAQPILRTPPRDSGGSHPVNHDCTGAWRIDMNEFAAGGSGGNPSPTLREPGATVHCQWWGRDPGAVAGTALTDALQYVVRP